MQGFLSKVRPTAPEAVGLQPSLGSSKVIDRNTSGLLLFLGVGGNRFQGPFLLRELSSFQFGVNQVTIDRDLKATTTRRNQF